MTRRPTAWDRAQILREVGPGVQRSRVAVSVRRLLKPLAMTLRHPIARTGALLACLGALLAIYFALARPWFLRWGATDAEIAMQLPGDEIVTRAASQETRAITIQAPAGAVFPWLAQIGQDRAGFYSYQSLENLFGCEMPDVRALDPRLARWTVGDKLWMYPPRKAGGAGFAVLMRFDLGHALVFGTRQLGTAATAPPDASWAFVVQPIDETSSRVLFRGRGAGGLHRFAAAFTAGVFEPVHFAMEQRTLQGVKMLAEGRQPSRLLDDLQVATWAMLFVGFVVSGVLVLAGYRPGEQLAAFVACGLLFQLLTLAQPSPLIGLLLLFSVGGLAAIVRRRAGP